MRKRLENLLGGTLVILCTAWLLPFAAYFILKVAQVFGLFVRVPLRLGALGWLLFGIYPFLSLFIALASTMAHDPRERRSWGEQLITYGSVVGWLMPFVFMGVYCVFIIVTGTEGPMGYEVIVTAIIIIIGLLFLLRYVSRQKGMWYHRSEEYYAECAVAAEHRTQEVRAMQGVEYWRDVANIRVPATKLEPKVWERAWDLALREQQRPRRGGSWFPAHFLARELAKREVATRGFTRRDYGDYSLARIASAMLAARADLIERVNVLHHDFVSVSRSAEPVPKKP